MSYAVWIALAVVLIAIGPALVRNMRGANKRGSSTDAGTTPDSSADRHGDDATDGDGGSAD
ncbi:MAG: hypothetical protein ACKOW1_03100 [Novosphingobium sp.]